MDFYPGAAQANPMEEKPLTAEQYRELAGDIRATALGIAAAEVRTALMELADRYDRLAARAEQRG